MGKIIVYLHLAHVEVMTENVTKKILALTNSN